MVEETENLVLALLRQMRSEMAEMRSVMATKDELRSEIASLRSEVTALRADVASDLMTLEKRLGDQIAGLRRSVPDYHSSVVGHGVLLSELDDRVRRIERHIGLAPETH